MAWSRGFWLALAESQATVDMWLEETKWKKRARTAERVFGRFIADSETNRIAAINRLLIVNWYL